MLHKLGFSFQINTFITMQKVFLELIMCLEAANVFSESKRAQFHICRLSKSVFRAHANICHGAFKGPSKSFVDIWLVSKYISGPACIYDCLKQVKLEILKKPLTLKELKWFQKMRIALKWQGSRYAWKKKRFFVLRFLSPSLLALSFQGKEPQVKMTVSKVFCVWRFWRGRF